MLSMGKRAVLRLAGLLFVFLSCSLCLFASRQDELKAKYDPIIQKLAARHGVPADLVHAVIKAESNVMTSLRFRPRRPGLMQLMPETAMKYRVLNILDPEQNNRRRN